MSDSIKHECGLAYVRLLRPISYYHRKYGTAFYGLNKLYLLMEKQHNRGQDGAGIATLKLNMESGAQFLHRLRVSGQGAIKDIFQKVNDEIAEIEKSYPDIRQYPGLLKGYLRFMGEAMLGHLRYGTQGKNNVEFCHPFVKADINPSRTLTLAGNFNLVNTDELFGKLQKAQWEEDKRDSDLAAMIETIYKYICEDEVHHPGSIDLERVLTKANADFDGGYVCGGLIGSGDSFVMRDKHGIRPAYYYHDDEVAVVASERPAIMTSFNVPFEEIHELLPGHAFIVDPQSKVRVSKVAEDALKTACSFERIYFSRGSDAEIYKERMALGNALVPQVLTAINSDLKNTIFSFIPNTAEIAFYGMIKGLEDHLKVLIADKIINNIDKYSAQDIRELIHRRVRIEKIAIKDVKLRTFITEDASRDEMVQHVYDITYGTVVPNTDTLVVIDDSIVRGTTLKQSIVSMLARLHPKKIIVVSSAPQIRYPDCYGIDMSRMSDFIAFQAAVALLHDTGKEQVIQDVYQACIAAERHNTLHEENFVKQIYEPFTAEQISLKIAELLTPEGLQMELEIIYQSIEGLREACPFNHGDWYFTGNYPTPGGNKVANKAFLNWMNKSNSRAY